MRISLSGVQAYHFSLIAVLVFNYGAAIINSLATKKHTTKFSSTKFQKESLSKPYDTQNSKTRWQTV